MEQKRECAKGLMRGMHRILGEQRSHGRSTHAVDYYPLLTEYCECNPAGKQRVQEGMKACMMINYENRTNCVFNVAYRELDEYSHILRGTTI